MTRPVTRPSRLSLALLFALPLACSRPTGPTDCPPATREHQQPAEAETTAGAVEDAPPSLPARPEALTVTADDGHELRLWSLQPPGAATTAKDQAKDQARAIVLVHGRTWSALPDFDLVVAEDDSRSLMRNLAKQGFAVYALDLRGYGESPRDASGWLTPERAAADLAAALAFVTEREGEPPDLLGWSLGALVAQLSVQQNPAAARSLVLYGYPRDPDARAGKAEDPGAPAANANTEASARSDFITPDAIPEAAIEAFVRAALAADPTRADWRDDDQFNALDPATIAIPTLVIHGVDDPIARPLWQAKLFTRLQVEDRQWVILPASDHATHLERPADFERALLAFLAN